jgi:hypothetical protein
LLPPLVAHNVNPERGETVPGETAETIAVEELVESMESYTTEARDALFHAKIQQAHEANKDRRPDPEFEVGEGPLSHSTSSSRLYAG